MNQLEFEANTCNRRQARENACEQDTIGFGFSSNWLRKWHEFANQSRYLVKQNLKETALEPMYIPCQLSNAKNGHHIRRSWQISRNTVMELENSLLYGSWPLKRGATRILSSCVYSAVMQDFFTLINYALYEELSFLLGFLPNRK